MTDQLAINFDPPRARRSDPSTSHGAAVIAISRAATHREMALQAAGERGLSDFQLSAATGVAQTSIGCRRHSLVTAGLVVPRMVIGADGLLVQDRRTDCVPSGSPSLVWVAVEHQRADARAPW